ncbi:MAG TPA: hypothetical protein H9740_03135 [Candidatus Hungatella pullicola]|nr:hypothetical protein [Candidatus Hungatella pullicola]
MKETASCEYCMYYSYNEEYEYYECEMDLDEDDMIRFLSNSVERCPYFRMGNEYSIVKKQI